MPRSAESTEGPTPSDSPPPPPAPAGTRPTRALAWVLLPLSIAVPVLSALFWQLAIRLESPAPHGFWFQVWSAFDIGAENNVAVWYAATLWFVLGLFAVLAALLAPTKRLLWWLFALVCFVASADESAELHERLLFAGDLMAPYVPFDVYYTWIIPGTLIAIGVAIALTPLVLAVHRRIAVGIVVGGALFLIGAIVIETFTGLVHREAGEFTALYTALTYVEETFELFGLSLAIVALSAAFLVQRTDRVLSASFDGYRDTAD